MTPTVNIVLLASLYGDNPTSAVATLVMLVAVITGNTIFVEIGPGVEKMDRVASLFGRFLAMEHEQWLILGIKNAQK